VKRQIIAVSLAGIIVLLDQLTKILVSWERPNFKVIPGFFNIHYVENTGAAFGILQDQRTLLTFVSVLAVGVLLFLIFSARDEHKGMLAALALILAGTCGNLIDRVRLGYVVDFLQFHLKQYYWPSFNIADAAISVGVGILIFVSLRQEAKSLLRT